MPKILIFRNLIFFFYAGDINERAHVHVVNNKSFAEAAKIWFENGIELFDRGGLNKRELGTAIKVVKVSEEYLLEQWNKFKHGGKTRMKVLHKI